jgi:hypothetical protein
VVPAQELGEHLLTQHGLRSLIQEPIVCEMQALPVIQTWKELKPLPDNLAPLYCLPPPKPGFCCPRCTSRKCSNFKNLRAHLDKAHQIYHNQAITAAGTACYMQRWMQSLGNKVAMVRKAGSDDGDSEALALARMEAEEETAHTKVALVALRPASSLEAPHRCDRCFAQRRSLYL